MPIAVPPVIGDGFVPVVDLSAAAGSSAARAGRWASTLHRALNPVDCHNEARISIPFFRQPNFDAVIETQPSAPRDVVFQPTTSGAWLAAKSAADRRLA
jgi:isopenicillin N synthase-like dioxygenase